MSARKVNNLSLWGYARKKTFNLSLDIITFLVIGKISCRKPIPHNSSLWKDAVQVRFTWPIPVVKLMAVGTKECLTPISQFSICLTFNLLRFIKQAPIKEPFASSGSVIFFSCYVSYSSSFPESFLYLIHVPCFLSVRLISRIKLSNDFYPFLVLFSSDFVDF